MFEQASRLKLRFDTAIGWLIYGSPVYLRFCVPCAAVANSIALLTSSVSVICQSSNISFIYEEGLNLPRFYI